MAASVFSKDFVDIIYENSHAYTRRPYVAAAYHFLRILTGKKTPSNKTTALTKSVNMDILIFGTSNQLLIIRGS